MVPSIYKDTYGFALDQTIPGTAAASGNIIRCGLSTLGVALVQALVDGLGKGWYSGVLRMALAVVAAAWAIRAHGMEWRSQWMSQAVRR